MTLSAREDMGCTPLMSIIRIGRRDVWLDRDQLGTTGGPEEVMREASHGPYRTA